MNLLECIYTRRSVRSFTDQDVPQSVVLEIIKAGTWAPSGLNNQPWRFVIIRDSDIRSKMAELTKYSQIINAAPVCIAVLVNKDAMYNDIKDHQAMGACIQNMLLATHYMGLGAVWLGEILKNSQKVLELLELPDSIELMAVIALGYPVNRSQISTRKDFRTLILKEF